MPRFSERIGAVEPKTLVQLEGMTPELRNSIWNLVYGLYNNRQVELWRSAAIHIARFFRKVPVDDLPYEDHRCVGWVKRYFFELDWHGVYDLLEFIVESDEWITRAHRWLTRERGEIAEEANIILEEEGSGYRFISGVLTPISDKVEVSAVREAEIQSRAAGLGGSAQHIHTALELLGKKPEPDYRNAVKEAISAVESAVKQLSGVDSSGLDKALDELSRKTELHGALKSAFKSLYGYTSDEDGIRHAILEEKEVGFDEAKYMIVACSAFVNFLISKAAKVGLLSK